MNTNRGSHRERYHDTDGDKGEATGSKADPDELTTEIEVLGRNRLIKPLPA